MRLMLIVVTVAAAMLLDLRVSQATQMPWCAGTNTGHSFHYNCSLPTYEMCVQEVIAGNRGFCSPNAYRDAHIVFFRSSASDPRSGNNELRVIPKTCSSSRRLALAECSTRKPTK